jgi:hypothetical protein
MRASLVTSIIAHLALLLWYVVSVADPKPFDAIAVEPMTVDLISAEQIDQPAIPPARLAIDIPANSPMPDQQPRSDDKLSLKTTSTPADLQQTPPLETEAQGSSHAPQVGELVVGPRIAEPLRYSTSANFAESQSAGFDNPSESAAILPTKEIDAFKTQVQKCWNAPTGVANTEKLHVVLRVALARDGMLTTRPTLIEGSASSHGPALVESAIRALLKCQPYRLLPADRYEEWKAIDLNFSPNGMSGG